MVTKSSAKSSRKNALKSASNDKAGSTVKSLPVDVLDWLKANHGQDAARAAIEKFGVSYAHITDWLVKEGVQVKEAVQTLIHANKKTLVQKGGDKAKIIVKSAGKIKGKMIKRAKQVKGAVKKK